MKYMSKLLALVLALTMVLALATAALAAEDLDSENNKYTIKINNGVAGETYTAYKVFDVTLATSTGNTADSGFSYSIGGNSGWWSTLIDGVTADADGVYDNTTYGLKFTPSASDSAVYIIESTMTADQAAKLAAALNQVTQKPAAAGKIASYDAESANTINVTDSGLGYYFIDTTLGSLCSLDTTNQDVTINEKNTTPTLAKKIVVKNDQSADTDAESTTASIGDTINYKITVTAGKGTDKEIVVHDVMDRGLSLNMTGSTPAIGDFTFKKGDTEITDTTGWSVKAGEETGNDVTACTFEITIPESYAKTLDENDRIVITYSAKLNKDAEIAPKTNNNTAWLTYSNQTSTKAAVTVTTYSFDLIKTGPKDTTNTDNYPVLTGAKFKLYGTKIDGNETVTDKDNEITLYKVEGTDSYYRPAVGNETGVAIEAGEVTIKGLASGTYHLIETDAPAGYNKLAEPVVVKIETGNLTNTASSDNTYTRGSTSADTGIHIVNQTGTELPSTGGIGTTIFYVLGGILVVGAGVLLVTKKRMSDAQ